MNRPIVWLLLLLLATAVVAHAAEVLEMSDSSLEDFKAMEAEMNQPPTQMFPEMAEHDPPVTLTATSAAAASAPALVELQTASSRAVAPFGASDQIPVWGVNRQSMIWFRSGVSMSSPGGSSWKHIPGALTQISVGGDQCVWGVNAQHAIFIRTGINSAVLEGTGWQHVPGGLTWVSCGHGPSVWGVNFHGMVWYRNGVGDGMLAGKSWTRIAFPGRAKMIDAGDFSMVYVVDRRNRLWVRKGITAALRVGTHWKGLNKFATNVGVGRSLWFLDTQLTVHGYNIYRLQEVSPCKPMGNGVAQHAPGLLQHLSSGVEGAMWGVNRGDAIFYRVGTEQPDDKHGTGWFHVGGALTNIAVGRGPDYMMKGRMVMERLYSRDTGGDRTYTMLPGQVGVDGVMFEVDGIRDIHIGLSESSSFHMSSPTPFYEIVIGGWGGVLSGAHRWGGEWTRVPHNGMICPGKGKRRAFWLTYAEGKIALGCGYTLGAHAFLRWADTASPLRVAYLGMFAGYGVDGSLYNIRTYGQDATPPASQAAVSPSVAAAAAGPPGAAQAAAQQAMQQVAAQNALARTEAKIVEATKASIEEAKKMEQARDARAQRAFGKPGEDFRVHWKKWEVHHARKKLQALRASKEDETIHKQMEALEKKERELAAVGTKSLDAEKKLTALKTNRTVLWDGKIQRLHEDLHKLDDTFLSDVRRVDSKMRSQMTKDRTARARATHHFMNTPKDYYVLHAENKILDKKLDALKLEMFKLNNAPPPQSRSSMQKAADVATAGADGAAA